MRGIFSLSYRKMNIRFKKLQEINFKLLLHIFALRRAFTNEYRKK